MKITKRELSVLEKIQDEYPELILFDGFNEALVGVGLRFGQEPIAAYSYGKCIDIIMRDGGGSYDDAVEYFEFNVIGAWVGPLTPVFISVPE